MHEDRNPAWQKLTALRRRLEALELQQAQFGASTPAHIVVEIADTRAQIKALEQQLSPDPPISGAAGTFRTLVVDQLHRGDHTTIGAAIAAARPGDRILVRPGFYREALKLSKPLELIGEGERDDIIVEAREANAIYFDCARGLVRNLTLRQASGTAWVVRVRGGRLDLKDCDISGVGNGAVDISGNVYARLRRNRIHDSGTGIDIDKNALGLFEDNDIGQANTAVAIKTGANPTLRRNRIHDNRGNGVSISENGQGLLEDNELFGHAKPAVVIKTGASPTLRRNRIHDNQGGGIHISESAQGLLEDNENFGHHAAPAVVIKTGASPTLRRNRIHDNQSNGVYILEHGQGLLEDNDIFGHTNPAVVNRSGASPTLRRNRIHDNASYGIWIFDGGGGTFEHNALANNKRGSWEIAPECMPRVTRVGNSA